MTEPPAALLEDLGPAGRTLVADVFGGFEVTSSGHRMLRAAAEAADRIDEARARIKADGLVLTSSRGGPTPHPLLRVERAAVQQLLNCLRQLGLPPSVVARVAEPPSEFDEFETNPLARFLKRPVRVPPARSAS